MPLMQCVQPSCSAHLQCRGAKHRAWQLRQLVPGQQQRLKAPQVWPAGQRAAARREAGIRRVDFVGDTSNARCTAGSSRGVVRGSSRQTLAACPPEPAVAEVQRSQRGEALEAERQIDGSGSDTGKAAVAQVQARQARQLQAGNSEAGCSATCNCT